MDPSTNARDIARIQSDVKTLFEQGKRREDRYEEIVTLMHSIDVSVGIMCQDQKATNKSFLGIKTDIEKLRKDIEKEVDKLGGEIEKIKDRPRNRWESLVTIVISVVASAVVVYMLSKVGL